MKTSPIKKSDNELQIVYGEVYAPTMPDVDGEFMTAETIRIMAHQFLMKARTNRIDLNHDNEITGCFVVESFIARAGDPVFIEDAWVVGIYIPDVGLWDRVKSGEFNGLSLEALVKVVEREVEITIPESIVGETMEEYGHVHQFTVKYSDDGTFLGGVTDVVNGHKHDIVRGTVTKEADGHSHKFAFVDIIADMGGGLYEEQND